MKNYIKKFVLNSNQQNSFLSAHISSDDDMLGRLVVIANIHNAHDYNKKIVKQLVSDSEDRFFNSVAKDSEKALEDTLQKINFSISETIKNTSKDWLKSSSILIGCIHNEEVHFARIGKISAFLVSNKEIIPITENSASDEVNPVKAFGNIYSGMLPENSAVIFLTDNILDYLSQEKLRKICSESSSDDAVKKIEQLLKKAITQNSYGLLLIRRCEEGGSESEGKKDYSTDELEGEEEEEKIDNESKRSEKIDNEQVREEDEQEVTIKPLGETESKALAESADDAAEENEIIKAQEDAEEHLQMEGEVKKELNIPLRALGEKTIETGEESQAESETFNKNEDEITAEEEDKKNKKVVSIMKPDNQRIVIPSRRTFFKKAGPKHLKHKRSKLVMEMIAIFIIVSAGILAYNAFIKPPANKDSEITKKEQPDSTEQESANQILLNSIQSKFIDAQKSIIDGDNEQAQIILKDAQAIIEEFPETTSEEAKQKESLKRKVGTQLLLVQGVSLVIPKLLIEITDFVPQEMVLRSGVLYLYDTETSGLYELNLKSLVLSKISVSAENVGSLQKVIDQSGVGITFYHSLDSLLLFDLEKKELKPLEWVRSWSGIPKAADIYQNKLYVISQNSQLLKYPNSLTGYTQETSWLKNASGNPLNDAVDIAIDGNIWILKRNAEIYKFFVGERVEFVYSVTPPFENPNKLYTDLGLNYLYILEPAKNRVAIINKENGMVVDQFTAEEFVGLSDIAIDEKNHKIYLLDETRLFEVQF